MGVAYGVCLLAMQETTVVLGVIAYIKWRVECLVSTVSEDFNVLGYTCDIKCSNGCRVGYVCGLKVT